MQQNNLLNSKSVSDKFYQTLRDSLALTAVSQGYIPEESFLLKCRELWEILSTHTVCYIVGSPGSGKTVIWKTLSHALTNIGKEVLYKVIYPQLIFENNIFDQINFEGTELPTGVLNVNDFNKIDNIMSQNSGAIKWTILDGYVRPELLETLNKIEDSDSRSKYERLIIETTQLQSTTSAMMTKGGILSVKDDETCFKLYLISWLIGDDKTYARKKAKVLLVNKDAKQIFKQCFDQHYNQVRQNLHLFQYMIPFNQMAFIQCVCSLIDAQLEEHISMIEQLSLEQQKKAYEGIYLYAIIWGLGGSLSEQTDNIDYCKFDKMWREHSLIRYPEQGWCFDYYFDVQQLSWINWDTKMQDFKPNIRTNIYSEFFVPTAQTVKLTSMLSHHVQQRRPFLLAGPTGTGKTILVKNYLSTLDPRNYNTGSMSFNGVISSDVLTKRLQKAEEHSKRQALYFIDDLSLAIKDSSHIDSCSAAIRQFIEMNGGQPQQKEDSLQEELALIACCNLKLPSLVPDQRLLRHFSTFTMTPPSTKTIQSIYSQIFCSHLPMASHSLQDLVKKLVDATLIVFKGLKDGSNVLVSLKKFDYQFSLREFSQVIQGLMMMSPEIYYNSKNLLPKVCKLWIHECRRTFEDKMQATKDIIQFNKCLQHGYNHLIQDNLQVENDLLNGPIFFTSFVSEYYGSEKCYLPIDDFSELKNIIEEKLIEYNLVKPHINVVLFDSAIAHIVNISRLLITPGGHGLLVGIPGAGRESLVKLSAFILNFELHQMVDTLDGNTHEQFKVFFKDVIKLCLTQPNKQHVLLVSDLLLQNESNLTLINDILTFGITPHLFEDNNELYEKSVIDKIKRNMHIMLMVSSFASDLKDKAEKFPGILKSTMIVWFHEWTKNALIELGEKFLNESEIPPIEDCQTIETYMKEFQIPCEAIRSIFIAQDYKSQTVSLNPFSEFIQLCLPVTCLKNVAPQFCLLENGSLTLSDIKDQIRAIQERDHSKKMRLLELQRKQISNLNSIIVQESEKIKIETKKVQGQLTIKSSLVELYNKEDAKLEKIYSEITIPIMRPLHEIPREIGIRGLDEILMLDHPPLCVVEVGHAFTTLLFDENVIHNNQRDDRWRVFKRLTRDYKFLQCMLGLVPKIEDIPETKIAKVKNIIETSESEGFNFDFLSRRSRPTALLGKWVIHAVDYYEHEKSRRPLRDHAEKLYKKVYFVISQISASKDRVKKANSYILEVKQKIEEAKIKQYGVEQEVAHSKVQSEELEKLILGLSLTKFAESY